MPNVWRIEKDGKGPITGGGEVRLSSLYDLDGPDSDPGICTWWKSMRKDIPERDNWLFGFSNLHQFRKWVRQECRQIAHERGCMLVCYRVPEGYVRTSRQQAIFDSRKAKRVTARRLIQ